MAWERRPAKEFELRAVAGARPAAITAVARLIGATVPSGQAVIDVGCGVGLLARSLPRYRVIGLDWAQQLLDVARKHSPVVRGDAFALPFQAASAAAVTCLFVLDDYPSPEKEQVVQRLAAVLKPGGLLILAGYAPDDERMGARRSEVGTMGTTVYLEYEQYYRTCLSGVGLPETFRLEHVDVVTDAAGSLPHMRRHFLVSSVQVGPRRPVAEAPSRHRAVAT